MLVVDRIGKTYPNGVRALDGISLNVAPGEILVVIGGSGCGKSTMLRAISGLDTPSQGKVVLDGMVITAPHEQIGIIFQEPRLVPRPQVLLLDEPFSALDAFTRADLQDHLLDLWADSKPTLIVVTHDVEEAIVLADRIMVMRPHPGRVYEEILCDLPRPRDRQSAAFDFVKRRVLAALDRSLERAVITDDGETRAAAGGGLWW